MRAPAIAANRRAGWSIARQRELGIDPRRSFAVGDRWLDIALARTVGARASSSGQGYGAAEEASASGSGCTADCGRQ